MTKSMDYANLLFIVPATGILCALIVAVQRLAARFSSQRAVRVCEKQVSGKTSAIDLYQIEPFKPDFDWKQQKQTPYRPWNNGPYHVTMGLKQATVENWIDLDDTYLDKYTLKKRLYREDRDKVLSVLPGCEEGLFEAVDHLKETLVRRYPTMFRLKNAHTIENLVTGDVWDVRPDAPTWEKYHPLEVMGLLTTEDFFLLYNDHETGITTLRAAGVCFPAGFKIEERIGASLWEIHAGKVPQYESKLAKSMDRFFMRMKVGSAICRFNYAIDDSDELFHRHSHHNLTPEQLEKPPKLEDLHLRVERQVLQRLPKTKALLFSIRTYVTPIAEVTQDREIARALRTSVDSFTEDVARYKNKSLWDDLLKRHLESVLEGDEER